jgi:hypothetical protein
VNSIGLHRNFEGLLDNVFDGKMEVYFIGLAWDLSGEEPYLYPGKAIDVQSVRIPIKTNSNREFIGDGALLFPPRVVSSGLAVRIQVWESDEDVRKLGKTISSVSDAVSKSSLTQLLSLIALAGGPTTATLSLIKDASLELAGVIGTILQANSDDFVDFYEGFYSASDRWGGSKKYEGFASDITLGQIT